MGENLFNNRVYGVVGIKSIMSNFNADFSGRPRTTSNDEIYGSDKEFKFPIKKMWELDSKNKVMYVRSYKKKEEKGEKNIIPRDLSERYEFLFGESVGKDQNKVIGNLFKAIDVMNFGATFAESKCNISITGAVQVGQGFNKYKGTSIEIIDILSPFRNSNKESAMTSSLGAKIVSDEAHYYYPFSVNPSNYDIYKDEKLGLDFEGYTEDAYNKFKEGCLKAATAYNTNSKLGCENEFAAFVKCKEGSKLYLANLDQYIKFQKVENDKDIIDISELIDIVEKHRSEIEEVEIYYNTYTLNIKGANENCILKELY